MFESTSRQQREPARSTRTLKIEAEGDAWKGLVKPKIRLMGRWLERAGFRPGSSVQVTCVASGMIELRSADAATEPAEAALPEPFEHPF